MMSSTTPQLRTGRYAASFAAAFDHSGGTSFRPRTAKPFSQHKNFRVCVLSNGGERKVGKWFGDPVCAEARDVLYHAGASVISTELSLTREEVGGHSGEVHSAELKRGKSALPQLDRRRTLKILEIQKLRENKKEHGLFTAISLLKEMATAKLLETAEAHFCLNIDPKYNDQQLRATVNLPKGIGASVRVAVLAQGELLLQARISGADLVGEEDLMERIQQGFTDFDILIASRNMMFKASTVLEKLLPSRGLMLTVTDDVRKAVAEFKNPGRVEYRADKTGMVHLTFGRADFPEEDLRLNLLAAVKSVEENKPHGAKETYWKSAYVCSSMGPSIRLNLKDVLDRHLPLHVIPSL